MILALSGAIRGQISEAYKAIQSHKLPIDWLLCTGSFGVWPDPAKVDRATKQREGSGDFARYYIQGPEIRLQTLFISGVHEDHTWLKNRLEIGNMEVLSNVHWLANGYRTVIGDSTNVLRITGFGKAYSENTFNGKFSNKSKRHYTKNEFEKACSSGPTDILMFHEEPKNNITRKIIFATRPKLILYSYYKEKDPCMIMDTPAIPLAPKRYLFITYSKEEGFKLVNFE